jgi:serine/threonine protein kinase
MQDPSTIGDTYQVLGLLGTGTLATVYRCLDTTQPNREVAVKVLFPDISKDARAISRIKRDFEHLRLLSHPNIVGVFNFIESEEHIGYSMELVDGGDLSQRLDMKSSMSIATAINIVQGLCKGIQAIHDQKMIHRNIKPENVLLTSGADVKISDFCCSGKEGSLKNEDGVAATLDYIPPEYMSSSEIDWRADIYAVGMLGYEILTGQSPFRGNSVYETMTKRLQSEPSSPSTIRTDCPKSLDAIIVRAMHRDPDKRFQSAREMLLELNQIS